ncbi:transglycosylase SLT domain-containing protein [Cytophaga hutchinsonii]|uniref:Peptidoglycan-binding lytic transglycosylase-related protein, glycoside hydrolase family 23 protein n=1 Tax=Cytophaga hutchinsonii (strain ATCC 33406 / DSM 1761 / CIP 103989 / NBRC 15051 / NCIMB 9469 / D465) TaxID=269798 RepID=A0A6N4SUP8_CYTH3|nr:transglycosylase SLT domain-containing protein [Cytophaga hutchinsonii]ABG60041.1 peptidoglycan-binding lytic transglycosylase-related protein, glycoside hydrolase family 23 protein [Cytophaga hutchinsonii ATCC 33406]SFX25204.1 membrane-bound lytic murein transglycosylase F [Cytophaga hutchinsonii ATCC 33406]
MKQVVIFIPLLIFFYCCQSAKKEFPNEAVNDLLLDSSGILIYKTEPHIDDPVVLNPLKTKKLKLLIVNNANTFFVYKGEAFGLEYELLKLFLKEKKIDCEIILVNNVVYIRDSLHFYGGHMAASTFIIPDKPMPAVCYSKPIYMADLVLVKHKDHVQKITNVTLLKDAPYVHYLRTNSNKPLDSFTVTYTAELLTKEFLLRQVNKKEIEATIVDANEAAIAMAVFPDLVLEKIIEHNAPVGFMFHSEMDTLRSAFDSWLVKNKNTSDYQWILKKYRSLPADIADLTQTQGHSVKELLSVISLYDDIIKKHAKEIGWDWRMVASLIHQESHFKPNLKSWEGACGLMQVMPRTALIYGRVSDKDIFKPQANIIAGTKYIRWIENNYFLDSAITKSNKEKFILASYNAGAGHVEDARALCKKYKLDPNVWEDNVEKMLLAKTQPKYYNDKVCKYGYCRGYETTDYVNTILRYYKDYTYYY